MPEAPGIPDVPLAGDPPPAVLVVSPREALLGALEDGVPGIRVVRTSTGRDALAHLGSERFAVILLDIILADGDGRSFLRRIRDDPVHATAPVVVADPVGSREMADECRALGVEAVLPPGTSREEIRDVVLSRARPDGDTSNLWAAELSHGLLNRAEFREVFEQVMGSWATGSMPPLLGRLAPDDPSALAGDPSDEVLGARVEALAWRAVGSIPPGEGVARWERGDFVVLWTDIPLEEGIRRLDQARSRLSEEGAAAPSGPSISFSGALAPVEPGARLDGAMDRVRSLLMEARASGGGRVLHPGSSPGRGPVRVLLADDDPLTAAIVLHRLKREEMEVTHVEDGLAALDEALTGVYDLLVLDVKMPGIDGFDLLARVRDTPDLREVPVLMLTGMGREPDIVRGFSLGADDYMVKPFSPAELMARVGRLLSGRASPRSRR